MAERVVTTEALVVGSRASGEASLVLTLFTRELGLVQVYARGVRLHKAKLRYHVQDYAFAQVTLVPGVEYWRLIGAVPIEYKRRAFEERKPAFRESLPFVAQAALLINRFMGLHQAHPEVFDLLESCEGDSQLFSLRLLDALGYVGVEAISPTHATALIERAYRESHL